LEAIRTCADSLAAGFRKKSQEISGATFGPPSVV
jgi:hypothetical protein